MAATPDGQGYWLVASDGGIFAYRAEAPRSSASRHTARVLPLSKPIVAMGRPRPLLPTSVTSHTLVQVSRPTTTWCAAVDNSGNAYTYSSGKWSAGTAVSGATEFDGLVPTTTFCMAVSYDDGFDTYNGSSWSAMSGTTFGGLVNTSFTGVSCGTSTFCAVSDFLSGHEVVYNSGVWTGTASPAGGGGQGMPTVSCLPGTKTCMMVDNDGEYVTCDGGGLRHGPGRVGEIDPSPNAQLPHGVSCLRVRDAPCAWRSTATGTPAWGSTA